MPGLNGIDAARRMAAAVPGCKVIMLSMHQDEQRVVESIRAGAAGYLMKDVAVAEVATAIERIARRTLHQPQCTEDGNQNSRQQHDRDKPAVAVDDTSARSPAAHRRRTIDQGHQLPSIAQREDG